MEHDKVELFDFFMSIKQLIMPGCVAHCLHRMKRLVASKLSERVAATIKVHHALASPSLGRSTDWFDRSPQSHSSLLLLLLLLLLLSWSLSQSLVRLGIKQLHCVSHSGLGSGREHRFDGRLESWS